MASGTRPAARAAATVARVQVASGSVTAGAVATTRLAVVARARRRRLTGGSSRGAAPPLARRDGSRHRAAEGAVGHDGRVLARATGYHDEDVLGRGHPGQPRVGIAGGVHPRRPVLHAVHATQSHQAQRLAGVLVDEALNVAALEAVVGDRARV